jgi:TetR/AcrR family transcriptional regulator
MEGRMMAPKQAPAPRVAGNGLGEILRQSSALMATRGYHATSMRELAHATGRSLSGLYHYFRGKEDLLFLINQRGFERLDRASRDLERAFPDPIARLYAFIYLHTRHFVDHMDEMRVMTWGTQELAPERAREIQQLKDRYAARVRDAVRDVHRSVAGAAPDAARLDRETFILFGMMNWMFTWYSPDVHGRPEELIDDVFGTFTGGLGARTPGAVRMDGVQSAVAAWYREHAEEGAR